MNNSITLITSLYKSEEYLKKYIRRIKKNADFLLKNNIDFEIVIISNDSTIDERQELEKFKNLNKWIKVFYVSREPLYASWNRGVELAKNEIIGFWNVDDVRYPEAVIDGIRLIGEGTELVYFPFWYLRYIRLLGLRILVKKKLILPPPFNRKEFTRSMHCGPFFIFTKSLYKKVGPFDEQFKIAGDFDWCVRAAKVTEFKLSKEIAGKFIKDGSGLSGRQSNSLQEVENNIIYKRYGSLDKMKKVDNKLLKRYNLSKIYYQAK